MTRREFLAVVPAAAVIANRQAPVIVPVNLIQDSQVKWRPEQLGRFWWRIWPQAAGDLGRCGIRLQTTWGAGAVGRPPFRQPVVTGVERGEINLVVTDRIPMEWDHGVALSGVTTLYRGYHLCMIAMDHAHGHQIPFLSVNTCLHELLHALLHDVFEGRPKGLSGQAREFRVDWYATRLWLFRDGAAIRKSAAAYVERLRAGSLTARPAA
jgi:hypothetical protein